MIVKHGQVLTMTPELSIIGDGAVRVENGLITHVGDSASIVKSFPAETAYDADGMLIMPGMICGHTHFYGAFARGLGIPGKSPSNFSEILQKLWWKLDKALDYESVRYSALVCLIDAIRHGTTTLFDHHASPGCIDGSLDVIAEAVIESGLRACLCYEVTDRNGEKETLSGIRENIRFIKLCRQNPHPSLAASFGLHASLTLSDKTLDRCCAENETLMSGFHVHAAEGLADQIDSVKKTGTRVIERLARQRILGERTILAHCVHVDDDEIRRIAQSGSRVTHQPRSNMNNAVGTAPVDKMLSAGIPVSLGNDGFSNNMWAEWKTAYLVHKLIQQDPRVAQGYDIMKMGVTNNAEMAALFWADQKPGVLQPGSSADLVLVDYTPFTPLSAGNLPWHILFGFEADMIHSTMARGQWLMRDRKLLHLDEAEIIHKARESAKKVWDRFEEGFSSK